MIEATPSLVRPGDPELRQLAEDGSRERLLARAKELQAGEAQSADQLATAAFCLWRARQWKRSNRLALEAVHREVTAWTVCVYAYSLLRDRGWEQLGEDGPEVARLLDAAAQLPDCPEVAVLRAVDAPGRTTARLQIEILERMVREEPSARESRVRLAERYLSGSPPAFDMTLDVLRPLLDEDPPSLEAAWLGAQALRRLSRTAEALSLLEDMRVPDAAGDGLDAFHAILLGELGQTEAAMLAWGSLAGRGNTDSRVMALFARAELLLANGEATKAAAEIWPVVADAHADPRRFVRWVLPPSDSGHQLPSLPHPATGRVAARLALLETVPGLESRVLGRLALVALEGGLPVAAAELGLPVEDARELLTEAADTLAPDPRLHPHVARQHATAGRWDRAVRHSLVAAISDAASESADGGLLSRVIVVPWEDLEVDALRAVHAEVVAGLQHPLAVHASAVFRKLYHAGWHAALMDAELLAEAAVASRSVLGHTRIEGVHAAGLGYQAETHGDPVAAERWYRLALEFGADHPGVLHRLARLVADTNESAALQERLQDALGRAPAGAAVLEEPLPTFPALLEATRARAAELAEVGKYEEAADVLLASGKPAPGDLDDAAWYFGRAGMWEEAEGVLTESIGRRANAWTYCYWTVVLRRDRSLYSLTAGERATMRSVLEIAVAWEDCPEWGVHDLVDLYEMDSSDPLGSHRIRELLSKVLPRYAESVRLRLRLVTRLVRGASRDYDRALDVLAPLLANDAPPVAALWSGYESYHALGRTEESLKCLERIASSTAYLVEESPGVLAALSRTLATTGRREDAVAALEPIVTHPSEHIRIAALLFRAALHDEWGGGPLVAEDIRAALNAYYAVPTLNVNLKLTVPHVEDRYPDAYGIGEIEAILEDVARGHLEAELDPVSVGRASWVLFSNDLDKGSAQLDLGEAALRLAPDVRYHEHLSEAYVMEGRFAEALEHHLLAALHEPDPARRETPFAVFSEEAVKASSKKVRSQMAATFCRILEPIDDVETAKAIFLPVLRKTLWPLLYPLQLWSDTVKAASLLGRILPHDNNVAFYHAYAAAALKDDATAEKQYRAIIAREPDHASALNNLGVIRQRLRDPDEALSLYRRAASVEPESELYRNNVAALEKELAKRPASPGRQPVRPPAPADGRIAETFSVPDRAVRPLESLTLQEAVYLLGTIRFAGTEDPRSVAPVSSVEGRRLSPTRGLDVEILSSLYKARLLFPRPDSPKQAFAVEGDKLSFYPTEVVWSLGEDAEEAGQRIAALESRFREARWPESWTSEWQPLAERIAYEECAAYLVLCLEEHGLPFTPGAKTRLVLGEVLADFSPAETYNFIWRAARDAAALTQRSNISRTQAANSAIGAVQRSAERARVQNWDVTRFKRDRRLPESSISQLFYNTVLQVGGRGFNEPPSAVVPPFLQAPW